MTKCSHPRRSTSAVDSARRVFQMEADALRGIAGRLNGDFNDAASAILDTEGRVIVCGMGKSGIVGHKVAATLMSTGTPAFHMHPGEAFHGDLGMVTPSDLFLAISNSGETEEVLRLLPYLKANGNFLISMSGSAASTLATASDVHLDVAVEKEACPLQLAPTSSTTAALVMGDALAVAVMEARGFGADDFAKFHPGGSLGRRLLTTVDENMSTDNLPIVTTGSGFKEVLEAFTRTTLGLVLVQSDSHWAIITDGDLRRGIQFHGEGIFSTTASDLMTRDALGVPSGTRMEDALMKMHRENISSLLVLDGQRLVGVIKR